MNAKTSISAKLRSAAAEAAIGNLDPLPHLLAIALENEEIAETFDQLFAGKIFGQMRLATCDGDLQSGVMGTVEIPFFSADPKDGISEPIFLHANMATKEAHIVSRPVQASQGRPFVSSLSRSPLVDFTNFDVNALDRERAFFERLGITRPIDRPIERRIENLSTYDLVQEILKRQIESFHPELSPKGPSTGTNCNTFTGPNLINDGQDTDDC